MTTSNQLIRLEIRTKINMSKQLISTSKTLAFLSIATVVHLLSLSATSTVSMSENLVSVEFEVYGRVQGVFFRKFTQKEAKKLNVRGWCMNTSGGTVKGVLEGDSKKVSDMKRWLETTGSPSSKIDKAVFSNQHSLPQYTFEEFVIKR